MTIREIDSFPLAWGQMAHQEYVMKNVESNPIPRLRDVWHLPGDVSSSKAEAALRYVICRHETLRTAFTIAAENRSDPLSATMNQRVLDTAPIETSLHRLNHDRVDGESLWREYFDPLGVRDDTEPTVRVLLVCEGHSLVALLVEITHAAIDLQGLTILKAEFFAAVQAAPGYSELELAPALHPRDQLQFENSSAMEAHTHRANGYIEGAIREASRFLLAREQSRSSQPVGIAHVNLRAGRLVDISRRLGVSIPQLIIGASSLSLSRAYSENLVVVKSLVPGRIRDSGRHYVAPSTRAAILRVAINPKDTIPSYMKEVAQASFRGYINANYDPRTLWRLEDELAQRLCAPFRAQCLFNFTRFEEARRLDVKAAVLGETIFFDDVGEFMSPMPFDQNVMIHATLNREEGLVKLSTGVDLTDSAWTSRSLLDDICWSIERMALDCDSRLGAARRDS